MATIETVKKQDGSVVYPQTIYSAVCDSDGTTLAQDMSSVIHSQSVQSVEELPELLRDVKINGTSVVEDGVANLPIATVDKTLGVVYAENYYGMNVVSSGTTRGALLPISISTADYQTKTTSYFISKGTLENIKTDLVGRALGDTTATAYTAEQQSAILSRIGLGEMNHPYLFYYDNVTEEETQYVYISIPTIEMSGLYITMYNADGIVSNTSTGGYRADIFGSYNQNLYFNVLGGTDRKYSTIECIYKNREKRYEIKSYSTNAGYGGAYTILQKGPENKSKNIVTQVRLSFNSAYKILPGTRITVGMW